MSGRRHLPDDAALFRAAMHDVKPLRGGRAGRGQESKIVAAGPAPHRTAPVARVAVAPPGAPANPGIDRRTAERLRKGEIAIERRVDLHGMTQDDAHATLDRFIDGAWRDGRRMLLVITGKGSVGAGGGVLRRHVPRWLAAGAHGARVLRVEPAQPRHGGSGALYVLLRRRREAP